MAIARIVLLERFRALAGIFRDLPLGPGLGTVRCNLPALGTGSMAKGTIDRLNETLNFMVEYSKKNPNLFTGLDSTKLKNLLVKTIQDDPYFDINEISEDIALGGTRLIKFQSDTDLRHLKRATLLLHRVMGYHSSDQTRIYKSLIANHDATKARTEFANQLARGVRLLSDSLHDWLYKTLAVDNGSLVHYYNQAEDSRLQSMDLTEDGWCLGVSTQWVRFQATGRTDFWRWMRTDEGAAAFRFVMAAQGVRTGGGHGLSDRAAFALRRFGVIQEKVVTAQQAMATPEAMVKGITNYGQRYCRIGQSYVGGGGHAMAASSGSFIHFMDPNAGEVRFATVAHFQSWLPKFIRRMKYHFARHYVELYTYHPGQARVDEPKPKSLDETLRDALAQRRQGMGY